MPVDGPCATGCSPCATADRPLLRREVLGAAVTRFYARTLPDTLGRSLEALEEEREAALAAAAADAGKGAERDDRTLFP